MLKLFLIDEKTLEKLCLAPIKDDHIDKIEIQSKNEPIESIYFYINI